MLHCLLGLRRSRIGAECEWGRRVRGANRGEREKGSTSSLSHSINHDSSCSSTSLPPPTPHPPPPLLRPHISTHVIAFAFTLPANYGDVFSACVGIHSINGGVIYNSPTVLSKSDRSGSSVRRDAGKCKTFAVASKRHDWQPHKLLNHRVRGSPCDIWRFSVTSSSQYYLCIRSIITRWG